MKVIEIPLDDLTISLRQIIQKGKILMEHIFQKQDPQK